MSIHNRWLYIGAAIIIIILVILSAWLIYSQQNKPSNKKKSEISFPFQVVKSATSTTNTGFLPLINKQPTQSPTPTMTISPTPTITATPTETPTPTPLILSFCDQAPAPIPIPDYSQITDTLTIEFPGQIVDLDVFVKVNHTYIGDLEIGLGIIDGPQSTLLSRPGPAPLFCDQDNLEITFDDEAQVVANGFCSTSPPAISGNASPLLPLYVFDNFPIASVWQITISDQSTPDVGTLERWCLIATLR